MSDEAPTKKPSPVEIAKINSNYLRGTIEQELVDGNDLFTKANVQLLKHHGTYQQDDREARTAREGGGKSVKQYMFMVRSRIPGGRLTSAQLLSELDLCDECGNGTLRITTRQGLQLHGVVKRNLHQVIRRINEVQLSTLAACGDVERNVMCCPAPHHNDPVHEEMYGLSIELLRHIAPRSRAYHEIWLRDPDTGQDHLVAGGPSSSPDPFGLNNGNGHASHAMHDGRANGSASEWSVAHGYVPQHASAKGDLPDPVEPIYGPTYLPRKFKTAIGLAGDNCVDLYANDLGLMAICERFQHHRLQRAGRRRHGRHAQRGQDIPGRGQADGVRPARSGDRRGHGGHQSAARFRQSVGPQGRAAEVPDPQLGLRPSSRPRSRSTTARRLPEPHPDDVHGFDDHLGWHEQGDGRWFYGLNVENGRIHDDRRVCS